MRLLSAAAAVALAAGPYAPATELARFADPRIDESSGVSAAARSDDVLFTHNDSGDRARFFALDRRGATLAVFDVRGARADDWEDMARGRADDGGPALFFGDIGDNFRRRPTVTVFVVGEPVVTPGADALVPLLEAIELVYEDGPHDAEALLVDPRTNALAVVTKARDGVAGVYQADEDDDVLRRVAEVRFDTLVRRPGAYAKAVTSGEMAPDGRRVVLRTPFEAFEWDLAADGDLAAALAGTPRRIPLPETRQGEAVAYTRDGRSLVTTSEGEGAPLHLLAGTTAGPDLLALREPVPPVPDEDGGGGWWRTAAGAAGGVVVLSLLLRSRASRRRRRRRPPRPAAPRA